MAGNPPAAVFIFSSFCCPCTDATLQSVGSYSCGVVASNVLINNLPYCSLYLAIVGALSKSSSQITMQIAKVGSPST